MLDSRWRVFRVVAESGSLTKAATILGTQQPVVSRQIAALERECGTRLFRRTGRGVVLSEFGEYLLPRVEALLGGEEALLDEIRTSGSVPRGEVRIGLLSFYATEFASRLCRELQQRYPEIRLHLTEGSSAQLQEWLAEGRIDLALHLRDDKPRGGEQVIQELPLTLVGSADLPAVQQPRIAFRDIEGLPLILPSEPHPLRTRLAQVAKEQQVKFRVLMLADTVHLQLELVAAGMGYGIVSPLGQQPAFSSLSSGARQLAFSELTEPAIVRAVVLSISPQRPLTLAARVVQKLLLALR